MLVDCFDDQHLRSSRILYSIPKPENLKKFCLITSYFNIIIVMFSSWISNHFKACIKKYLKLIKHLCYIGQSGWFGAYRAGEGWKMLKARKTPKLLKFFIEPLSGDILQFISRKKGRRFFRDLSVNLIRTVKRFLVRNGGAQFARRMPMGKETQKCWSSH